MTESVETKSIFRPLSADDPDPETTEIESFCMNCEKTGLTKLLLIEIPFYKEVVLMSFECPFCGYRNNEVQSGAAIEEKGVRFTLTVNCDEDLNRQVFKSDYTAIKIPEVELEIPSKSQKGEITTVEGVLDRSINALLQDQSLRRQNEPKQAAAIDQFVEKLESLKNLKSSFTFILEDISGNAFISSPNAPLQDKKLKTSHFVRSDEENQLLGIYPAEEPTEKSNILKPLRADDFSYEDLTGEVVQFPTSCSSCHQPCQTNMKLTNIPYFKDVVIMATNCDHCGHRTNEIKSGGGIEQNGVRMVLKATTSEDYTRDILKSETCCVEIPELELEVGPTALSGRFTTLEGVLEAVHEQLSERNSMFMDSKDPETIQRMSTFLNTLKDIYTNMKPITIILDDPAGNSYVQSLTHPSPDPGLEITHYERSHEQNDELGLNDMKTEGYETELLDDKN